MFTAAEKICGPGSAVSGVEQRHIQHTVQVPAPPVQRPGPAGRLEADGGSSLLPTPHIQPQMIPSCFNFLTMVLKLSVVLKTKRTKTFDQVNVHKQNFITKELLAY